MSKRILVVTAHPDDEILGVGGTIARHISAKDEVVISIAADKGVARYQDETIQVVRQCCLAAARCLGVYDVRFGGFADQKLDALPIVDLTRWLEALLDNIRPQVIYTHHRGDINRDHQLIHGATLTAARPYSAPYVERILCYEAPSATEWSGPYTENAFLPNIYVDITAHLEKKLEAMSEYTTELRPFPHPRSIEALRARAAFWGSVIGVDAAEPFVLIREIHR
jgi:LmbE family N-acetylglucosaminyl deacetylase